MHKRVLLFSTIITTPAVFVQASAFPGALGYCTMLADGTFGTTNPFEDRQSTDFPDRFHIITIS